MARRARKSSRPSKSRKSARRGRGRTKARRSYSRKGTRGRRGGKWTERRARKKARFYQGRYRKSHGKAARRNPLDKNQREALKHMRREGMVSLTEARRGLAWKHGKKPTWRYKGKSRSLVNYIDGVRRVQGMNPRRRNPVGQLRDGSMINVEGRSVSITSKYGETYEYDEVSGATLRALISAKTFSAAQKACNKSGVLRSINPKRGKRKGKKSRNDKRVRAYARSHHHSLRKGGKARRRAMKWYRAARR